MKRALVAVSMLALLLVIFAVGTWQAFRAFEQAPLELAERTRLLVEAGDAVGDVVIDLEALGATRYDWKWRLLLRLEPTTIQVGEYDLDPGMSPRSLLRHLASGRVVQHRFTVVEGWTYRQLKDALLAREDLPGTTEDLDPANVMQRLGSDAVNPEGWFLPETYAYVRGDSALDVLARAHRAMLSALAATWEARDPTTPLAVPYEMLILASIVEKESARADERGRIAGVFTRRLEQRWRLETDPTVIYGMGERYDGNIRRRDLAADTPYNTYTRHGLPPTPIAMPGLGALEAAARPEPGQAMFFVSDGQGAHVFSETLEDHNRAVQRLVSGSGNGG
jgi:UPF0755 protein